MTRIWLKMADIYFLGTGGSIATEERDNTSLLLDTEGRLILVDCPGSVVQKIRKLGFDPRHIKTILVTHVHPDHIYGLPSLVHSLMLDEGLIELYGSEETLLFCQDLLDLFHLRDKKIKTRVRFIPAEPKKTIELTGSLRFFSFPVPHDSSSLAFHFHFSGIEKDIILSGDSPVDPFLFQLASRADYLIHDCSAPSRFFEQYPSLYKMHTHALDLGRLCQEAEVRCLIPCHFFGELDFSLSEIEQEIKKNYQGKLIIPEDFEKIPV
jgi:ribonuclease Z